MASLYFIDRVFDRFNKVVHSLCLKDPVVFISLLVVLFLNIFMWVFFVMKIQPTDAPIPLHYNIYFGVDYIDMWYKVYVLPLFGILVGLINCFFIYWFYLKEKLLSYFLAVNTVFVHIFLFMGTYLIIWLNS